MHVDQSITLTANTSLEFAKTTLKPFRCTWKGCQWELNCWRSYLQVRYNPCSSHSAPPLRRGRHCCISKQLDSLGAQDVEACCHRSVRPAYLQTCQCICECPFFTSEAWQYISGMSELVAVQFGQWYRWGINILDLDKQLPSLYSEGVEADLSLCNVSRTWWQPCLTLYTESNPWDAWSTATESPWEQRYHGSNAFSLLQHVM